MFVRWKRKALYRHFNTYEDRPNLYYEGTSRYMIHHEEISGWIRTAYLIRAIRTEAGPRQEYLCRLGSFKTDAQGSSAPDARADFWREADFELRSRVDATDQERIIASLESVVPRPKGQGS
jgi:hypothetical protein